MRHLLSKMDCDIINYIALAEVNNMKLEWMGDYRELLEKLIHYCNQYANSYKEEQDYGLAEPFSFAQIQVLEYLLENEELNQNMSTISTRLGVSLSAFSKMVNRLVSKGLLEKYYIEGNRKNIVVRVSPKGRELYSAYAKRILEAHFSHMFDVLKGIPPEYVAQFARALERPFSVYRQEQPAEKEPVLIPCDK